MPHGLLNGLANSHRRHPLPVFPIENLFDGSAQFLLAQNLLDGSANLVDINRLRYDSVTAKITEPISIGWLVRVAFTVGIQKIENINRMTVDCIEAVLHEKLQMILIEQVDVAEIN